MEGGAMAGLREALLGDRKMSAQDLAEEGLVWAFNGRAGLPEQPLFTARLGETVVLEMINDTAWSHAMHLHGHHFRALAPDGGAGPLRDTLLLNRGEKTAIAFVADNPGDWLLHCPCTACALCSTTWLRLRKIAWWRRWPMPSRSTSSPDRPRCSAKHSSCLEFAWNVPSNARANFLFLSEKQHVDSCILSKFRLARGGGSECARAQVLARSPTNQVRGG